MLSNALYLIRPLQLNNMSVYINSSICHVLCAFKKHLSLAITFIFLSSFSFGQLINLEIEPNLSSGIVIPMDSTTMLETVQFKVIDMDFAKSEFIYRELVKYDGVTIGYGKSVLDSKIIVSYHAPFTANHILAILDRVNIEAYYDVNGEDVYYQKNEFSFFIR